MINKSRAQSSSLFLMELILAILFFSITSAVCVQFFVKSHLLGRESKALARAVNECSNIAEIYDTSDSIEDTLSLLKANFPEILTDSETDGCASPDGLSAGASAILHYNDAFSPCPKEEASYTLTAAFTREDSMLAADIQVTDSDDSVIYKLKTSHHTARRTDYEER